MEYNMLITSLVMSTNTCINTLLVFIHKLVFTTIKMNDQSAGKTRAVDIIYHNISPKKNPFV